MHILKQAAHICLRGGNSIASRARRGWTVFPLDKQGIVLEIWSFLTRQVCVFSFCANCFYWQFSKESTGRILQSETGHLVIKSGVKASRCAFGRISEQLATSWAINEAYILKTQAYFLTKHSVTGDFLAACDYVPIYSFVLLGKKCIMLSPFLQYFGNTVRNF